MRGETPSAQLLEAEKQARFRMDDAREKLHAAMTRALAGANAEPQRCVYMLSTSLGYRCSLPAGHDGDHHVEAGGQKQVLEEIIQRG